MLGATIMTSLVEQAHAAQPARDYCYNVSTSTSAGRVCGFSSAHDCNQARHNDERATGHCYRLG
jgi:hypothetical protein